MNTFDCALWVSSLAALGAAQESTAILEPESILSDAVRSELPRLRDLMREGIGIESPNTSIWRRAKQASLFDGSYDWHSCVIAHWALLRIARDDDDEELERFLLDRLSPEGLAHERELLKAPTVDRRGSRMRAFFYPYSDGWLAMLLAEIERRPERATEELRAFRLEVEARLVEWLEQEPFPEPARRGAEGEVRFNGFYRSWLFGFWLLEQSEPVTANIDATLARLREERIDPHRDAIAAQIDPHRFDFLFVPALLALVDRTRPDRDAIEAFPHVASGEWPDDPKLSEVHVIGLELSKLWPHALDAADGDATAAVALNRGLESLLAHEDLWAGEFRRFAHWVPQFVWITIWLAESRSR